MGDKSKIEWTDASWNPVTGCTKVSAGCKNCYAETVAKKFWASQYPPVQCDPNDPRVAVRDAKRIELLGSTGQPGLRFREFTDVQCHDDRLTMPLHWQRPRMVFVNSMSDLFHEDVPDAFIDRVFAVMALAQRHTFQVLTKRAERMRAYMTSRTDGDGCTASVYHAAYTVVESNCAGSTVESRPWPLPNVWLGVSVENQRFADERIPLLLQTPAAVLWISAEPLLGPVDLTQIANRHRHGVSYWNALTGFRGNRCGGYTAKTRLDWVVVGGESGRNHREIRKDWVWSLREQCHAARVAFFFKQWGGLTPKSGGRMLNGKLYSEYPRQIVGAAVSHA